jgi:ribosomal protein S18 acetylase RimI-like enzyme
MEMTIENRISRRPVIMPDDEIFLQDLYLASRDDLQGLFTDNEQMRQLLLMQYRAQALTYSGQFPSAEHEVILLDAEPVGRVMVDSGPEVMRLVDISLLPGSRNIGIGTEIMKQLLAECGANGLPCELSVLRTNPAQHLYERLGFKFIGEDETRLHMRWSN